MVEFRASDHHEIVGLMLNEDGDICGIHQVALAPTHAHFSPTGACDGGGRASMGAWPDAQTAWTWTDSRSATEALGPVGRPAESAKGAHRTMASRMKETLAQLEK